MFQKLLKKIEKINQIELEIRVKGKYPAVQKKRNKTIAVWKVNVYQNDGTDRIKAARYMESAIKSNKTKWNKLMWDAVNKTMRQNNILSYNEFLRVGFAVAKDFNNFVNRIDTTRLKQSFMFDLKKMGMKIKDAKTAVFTGEGGYTE